MSQALFERTFKRLLTPPLRTLGFREVLPPDRWIAPMKLFESKNRWFGASWDWRDRYLDVALGRLFRYRDVLPRVIVRGPYRRDTLCGNQDAEEFLMKQFTDISRELPGALEHFEEQLPAALRADLIPREDATADERRVHAEHIVRIGDPLTLEGWKGSRVKGSRVIRGRS
jgi:hypothetical protein